MKCLILILTLLSTSLVHAETLRVAIIDTGLDLNDPRFYGHICKGVHQNFVDSETLDDINNHGTHIAGLIQKYSGTGDYCFLIYKYYSNTLPGSVNLNNEVRAITTAIANGAKIINISAGGPTFDEDESLVIKYNPDVIFVVAAGNEGQNLDIPGNECYPASYFYGNMEVVGSIGKDGRKSDSSNYSKKVENKEIGVHVLSYLPKGRMGYMSGTSQATAIFTGKLVRKMLDATK